MKIFKKLFDKKIDEKLKEIESYKASYSEMKEMLKSEGCTFLPSTGVWYIRSRKAFQNLRDMGWKVNFLEIHENGLYECKIERL